MVKDVWDSFKDNIKERVTNPFLGTFALVWTVHNWRIVYAFFHFDKNWNLEAKINYFSNYWSHHSFILNLIGVALISVAVLIVTYIFLALSRYLSNYFENIVIPWIYKFSKGKTVTQEIHLNALQRIESLEKRIEEERKGKNEALLERDELEKKLTEYAVTKDPVKNEVETEADNKPSNGNNILKRDFTNLIINAKVTFQTESFEKTMINILKGFPFSSNDPNIDFLLKHGFVKLHERIPASGNNKYTFTEEGNEFKRQFFESNI